MEGRPEVITNGSGFVTSDGQLARIVIFQRKAELFEEFYRLFTQSWSDACSHEDLLLFHREPTAPCCRGLQDYEMWVLNNGSSESTQIAYDRNYYRQFAVKKIPADHLNRPLLRLSIVLAAWGLNTNICGVQMKEGSQELWLLLRIPPVSEERIPLGRLFKGFLQGTGDSEGVTVNVDMLKRALAEIYFKMAYFHGEGVSNLSLTVDSVNFCANRRDFVVDFLNLREVSFQGQLGFCSGQTRDLQNVNSMVVPYLEKMEMNRCLEDIHQKDHLEAAHIIVDFLTGWNEIQDQPNLRNSIEESNYGLLSNGRQPSDTVLRIAGIEIREVDYRSLDSTVPENEFEVIKKAFPKFRKGCLSDGVMIGFFMSLRKGPGPTVIVITTSELQKPEREINIDIQDGLRWILAPWNPGSHWILIAVDMKDRIVYYLDPDPRASETTIDFRDWEVLGKVMSQLKWKPNSIIMNIPGCSKQAYEDDNNCGVFVCFYAKQLVSGESLQDRVDSKKMRSYIQNMLRKHADQKDSSRGT